MGSSYHTIPEHMPSHHQNALTIKGWTKADLLAQGKEIGPSTYKAIEYMLCSSFYPEQNYKSAYGVLMLVKTYGSGRVEAACTRVLTGSRVNYALIKNILSAGLDRKPVQTEVAALPLHDNICGAEHYR